MKSAASNSRKTAVRRTVKFSSRYGSLSRKQVREAVARVAAKRS